MSNIYCHVLERLDPNPIFLLKLRYTKLDCKAPMFLALKDQNFHFLSDLFLAFLLCFRELVGLCSDMSIHLFPFFIQ